MKVLDLFAGLEGWSTPWRERGHDVFSVDLDERFAVDLHADVQILRPGDLPWKPDVVLASPPCEKFSVLTIPRYWRPGYQPTPPAAEAMEIVRATVRLIDRLEPAFWVIENPRAVLRKLHLIPGERKTVTYCQYGAPWRKPTDLWGGFPPSLAFRPMCHNGDPCHIAAPRGPRTGVQGDGKAFNGSFGRWAAYKDQVREMAGTAKQSDLAAIRAEIPRELALDVCLAAERDYAAGLIASDYTGRLFA
jgi:hypothetical protein